jgi:hypothetical protein
LIRQLDPASLLRLVGLLPSMLFGVFVFGDHSALLRVSKD